MTETVTKYQCTTCAQTFSLHIDAIQHTSRHRRKDALKENTTPTDFVREIYVEPDTTEEGSLYAESSNGPGEHDPEPLVENETVQTEKTHLWDYE